MPRVALHNIPAKEDYAHPPISLGGVIRKFRLAGA
jgi:hypothetical protein